MTFYIGDEYDGRVLLSYLKYVLKISASSLAGLKRDEKGILVNGQHVTVRYVLKSGDVLSLNEKDSKSNANEFLIPSDIPLNILFENDDIILIDKPPYMPTHPSHNHTHDTLANALAYVYKERNTPFVFRSIGRLDRNTSGISLIAKHSLSASYLFHARQKNLIKKKYLAVLCGKIERDGKKHTIDTFMKRQDESIIMRCICDGSEEGSYRATTHYRVLYSCESISIVEAIPETGRTHQLRVHFAHIGHAILGDDVYGAPSNHIDRHALHAAYLSIPLPYSDKTLEMFSPPPPDIKAAVISICGIDTDDICASEFKQQGDI